MSDYTSLGRTNIHVRCSASFKAKVAAFAARQGKPVSDVMIEAMADRLKFDNFTQLTDRTAAEDDWQMQVELARSNLNPLEET